MSSLFLSAPLACRSCCKETFISLSCLSVFVRSIVDGSLFLDSLSLLFVGGFVGLFVVRWFVGWLLRGILGGLVVGLVGVVVGGLVGGVVGGDVGGPLVHLRLVHGPVFWSVGQPAVASSVGRSVVMMDSPDLFLLQVCRHRRRPERCRR
jgi:hypothetical protein